MVFTLGHSDDVEELQEQIKSLRSTIKFLRICICVLAVNTLVAALAWQHREHRWAEDFQGLSRQLDSIRSDFERYKTAVNTQCKWIQT